MLLRSKRHPNGHEKKVDVFPRYGSFYETLAVFRSYVLYVFAKILLAKLYFMDFRQWLWIPVFARRFVSVAHV